MNIASSNRLSMLLSGEGPDTTQQLIASDGAAAHEFSDKLLKKMQQLKGVNTAVEGLNNLVSEHLNSDKPLHEFTGLSQIDKAINDLSKFVGKGLPQQTSLDKDINLKNTLETLSNILNTLNEGNKKTLDTNDQINSVIEKIEAIKQEIPKQVEAIDQLNSVAKQLKDLALSHASEPDKIKQLDTMEESVKQVKSLLNNAPNTITDSVPDIDSTSVAKQLNNLALSHANEPDKIKQLDTKKESVEQVKSLLNNAPNTTSDPAPAPASDIVSINEELTKSELDNKIERLSDDLQSIKKIFSQKVTATKDEQTEEINVQDLMQSAEQLIAMSNGSTEQLSVNNGDSEKEIEANKIIKPNKQDQNLSIFQDDSEKVGIEGEMAALLANIGEPKELDQARVIPVYQDVKPIQNKESLSIKQIVEQQNQGLAAKPESVDNLLQTVQPERKVEQDNVDSLLMKSQLQNQQTNVVEGKEPELSSERALPKFATDIANLNRAVMAENKAEIPPMTKHFANPEWNKEMGERLIWMHKQAIPSAELRLNPGHLGPVTIKIDVTQEQTTVAFTAQHAAVKEAIDAALPKLREMFSTQQLNLAEVSVTQEDARQQQHKGFSQMGSDAGQGGKQENEMLENEQQEITMDIAEEIEAGRAIASNGVLSLFA